MTAISDIYDNIQSVLSSNLSGYVEIPFPIILENNSGAGLNKAYGIVPLGANVSPADQEIDVFRILQRDFGIILINQASFTYGDATGYEAAVKSLMEDFRIIYKEMETHGALSAAIDAQYQGDEGVEFGTISDFNFLSLATVFSVRYRDNIST